MNKKYNTTGTGNEEYEFKGLYNMYSKLKGIQKNIQNNVRITKLSVDLKRGNVNTNN